MVGTWRFLFLLILVLTIKPTTGYAGRNEAKTPQCSSTGQSATCCSVLGKIFKKNVCVNIELNQQLKAYFTLSVDRKHYLSNELKEYKYCTHILLIGEDVCLDVYSVNVDVSRREMNFCLRLRKKSFFSKGTSGVKCHRLTLTYPQKMENPWWTTSTPAPVFGNPIYPPNGNAMPSPKKNDNAMPAPKKNDNAMPAPKKNDNGDFDCDKCEQYDKECRQYDKTCQEYTAKCQTYSAKCQEEQKNANCRIYNGECRKYKSKCQGYNAKCKKYSAECIKCTKGTDDASESFGDTS